MIPSTAQFQALVKNYDVRQEQFYKSRPVQAEVDYFKQAVGRLESVEDVFKDRRLVKFLATAVNLPGEEKYPGKMRRILSEDTANPDAAMNKLSDKRYRQAADVLKFGEEGLARLKSAATQDTLINSYRQQEFDRSIGQQNPALREALYFQKFAAGAADNVWEVLGDPVIRKVVTKTLGIPERIAFQPLETQAAVISSRLDISKLADKEFVDKFINRFLNQVDLEGRATNQGPQSWKTSLFSGVRGQSLNLFA